MPEGDRRKKHYAWTECAGSDPFTCESQLDRDVVEAIEWQARRTAIQVMSEREAMITKLELADQMMRKSGVPVLCDMFVLVAICLCCRYVLTVVCRVR